MIDYGIYNIQQNETTKEFILLEQLEGREYHFETIAQVVNCIENELNEVKRMVEND